MGAHFCTTFLAVQKPIGDNVFTWPADEPQLIGGRCSDCSAVTFPTQSRCPRCGTKTMEELALPASGHACVVHDAGLPPDVALRRRSEAKNFTPFGVGLVQLGDVVRVEGRLTEDDPTKLDFGMEVELQVVPFYTDADGDEIMTFAFAPVGAGN